MNTALELFDRNAGMIAGIVPTGLGLTADRIKQVLIFCMRTTPKLGECRPDSLVAAVVQIAGLGLDLHPSTGHAYLIPFKDHVQLVIGYKGLASLATRSGRVLNVTGHAVYSKDEFRHEMGTSQRLYHSPCLGIDRGDIVAAWAEATLANGHSIFRVIGMADIEAAKAASSGASKPSHPWNTWRSEMARKTAIRRLCRDLDIGSVMARAMAVDDGVATGLGGIADGGVIDVEYTLGDDAEPSEPAKSTKERLARKPKESATLDDLTSALADFGVSVSTFTAWLRSHPITAGKDLPPVTEWDGARIGWAVRQLANGLGHEFRAFIVERDHADAAPVAPTEDDEMPE